ncbi:MAG: mechanosensitive ion channel family protein [Bacteroidota bacterium]
MEQIFNILKSLAEPGSILLLLVLLLVLNNYIFRRLSSVTSRGNVTKNSISLFLVLFGTLALILTLPIESELKGQILSFLGIIISATIALSSTTLLGNLIAGIMNNSMKRFRNGDLIKIDQMQGRVTKKSIFHTEIQLEDSNFLTIPNLYIASNPVKLTRKTNSVISTSVSLGYDVSRTKIEEALKEAALEANLTDPYVYITNLGDFSVVYQIHGFLEDSSKFYSTRSLLNAKVMDVLHKNRIEIVSPNFVNQRRMEGKEFIPKVTAEKETPQDKEAPEELIFDEAIKSEKIEKKKDQLIEINKNLAGQKEKLKEQKDKQKVAKIKSAIDKLEKQKKQMEKNIEDQKGNAEKDNSNK